MKWVVTVRKLVVVVAIVLLAVVSCTSDEEADLQRLEDAELDAQFLAAECAALEAMTAAELRDEIGQDLDEAASDIEFDCGKVPVSLTPSVLSGEITSGEILVRNVRSISQNELEFTVDPVAGTVEGSGTLISEMTMNTPTDEECNGAPFTRTNEWAFTGTLDADGKAQGSLDMTPTAKADANCQDRFAYSPQTGTFEADYDPQAQTLVGLFTDERFIDSGFEAEGS